MNFRVLSVAALIALAVTALPAQKYIAHSATSAVGRPVSPDFVAHRGGSAFSATRSGTTSGIG